MESPPPGTGPVGSARALGATVLDLLSTRAELASIELKEEAERRKRLAVLALVAVLFIGSGLVLAAVLVVVLFWDTHRVAAIAALTLAYSAIGAWALLRLLTILRESPAPFSATLEEFRKDLDMIRGTDGDA